MFPFAGSHEFDSVFAYYLARNHMLFEGTKCKVCNQQLGIYCERCLPDKKCKRQDKHQVDHKFKLLEAANSHIYSKAVLLIACGGNDEDDSGPHEDILKGCLSKPKTITPGGCSWNLPECTRCDSSTSDLENKFKERYKGQYSSSIQTSSVDSDAVLFYIYIHRGLAVNIDLMHYLFCNNCSRYFPHIRKVLHQAWEFRRTILQNHHKEVQKEKKIQDMQKMSSKANESLLFHTIRVSPGEKDQQILIEFPFLCDVEVSPKVGSCALVYAQIPPCCWAIPLDPSSPALPELRNNFLHVIGRINDVLAAKHTEYLESIGYEKMSPKLLIRYLPKCCLKVSLV